ncbi:hypothetical protein BO78DRAFT_425986 [Aspergillus sclerotiicarbonarius CBS 121057]|uniref:Uncharacterized protein n=1 Tax=Aspergillus sclerotiicarbonarius (strain CBS 121057 / IBT 28362) TaxID=1448318 RepID=A0A319EQB8_ASPSB|nr:hypothetical protein BO78DRAFT_425986 [Aspergillus sclerotiicarbonarius CBS 121057]
MKPTDHSRVPSQGSPPKIERNATMNPSDPSSSSTTPSTSEEGTSSHPRPLSSMTSVSTVSDTSMEFTLHLVRTGDEDDEFQLWAVPVPSPDARGQPVHGAQVWMENLVAVMNQSNVFPVETNDALVAAHMRADGTHLGDVSTYIEAADEDSRTVAHDSGYEADESSGLDEENANEDEEKMVWIDVHWDKSNGPLEDAVGHKEPRENK